MNPSRSRTLFTLCLGLQFFFSLPNSAGGSRGLWGEKVQFKGQPCVWQLRPDIVVPTLKELSVCTLIRLSSASRWTGFVYKAPAAVETELGFGGTEEEMTVWLLGRQWVLNKLKLQEWTSVCLTRSAEKGRFRVYINETLVVEEFLNSTQSRPLTPNGTLTLGASQTVDAKGQVQPEEGDHWLGEIGSFRMWAREWSAEELKRRRCSDGDVVGWDEQVWLHNCPPAPDDDLHCAVQSTNMYLTEARKHHSRLPAASKMSTKVSRLGVGPDAFFRVDLTVNITADPTDASEVITQWLQETLEANRTMKVLNLIMKKEGRRYECAFHVREYKINTADQVITAIKAALRGKHSSNDFVIETQQITVQLIAPHNCFEETLSTVYGVYIWAETFPADTQVMGCTKPKSERAYRLCELNIETDRTRWATPDMSACTPVREISDIKNITVTPAALKPEVFVDPSFVNEPEAHATIFLPNELNTFFPSGEENKIRLQFQFFGTSDLFQDESMINSSWTLNSSIVSASINQTKVHNLDDKVVVTFRHLNPKSLHHRVKCVFWDFQINEGHGGWSSRGCVTQSASSNQTSCLCDHLTHFALLLDVSRTPIGETDSYILTIISYLGCGLSSIFLGITLVTYVGFRKLRGDYPSKILINLSAALLGLSLVFLLDGWLSSFSNYGLCIVTAASLHYFLLASFTWMGLEAVHMYLALVKVFNTYIPWYLLKFCAVGWGLPLLVVVLVLAIDIDVYGSGVPQEAAVDLQSPDPFCWIQDDVFFYVTVVAFVLFILLCNFAVLIVVLVQIRKTNTNKSSTNSRTNLQDLRAIASLTVLLGLTWAMGFLSFGPGRVVMMYLFAIFNTLQGFFVFLFHCLMKENVRKQWKTHLRCGRLGDPDHTEWSRTVTAGSRTKMKNNLVSSDSAASIETSNTRISESSSEPAPKQQKQA
ncbi:adhesion G-protein coupled receptor G6 isoform X4 [Synchiropus splendidus]|uniref:adhesion G-protein coupled receptor G6 isoform X4 n=1 Tax=Synchiropus splendidus TaxID=270530 RepID=UPI00237DC64B|nr:adhesion G-protein coupled receptor G6 isoform X4 [Synchiropus splendidus]